VIDDWLNSKNMKTSVACLHFTLTYVMKGEEPITNVLPMF